MDTKSLNPQSQTLSPSSSGRRRINTSESDCTSSPEFEFWMVRNPSIPQPNILSADELFVDGVLLPLHHNKPDPPDKILLPDPDPDPPASGPRDPDPGRGPDSSASITDVTATTTLSSSKRWKDIFRKSDKKNAENNKSTEEEGKKKERKGGATTSAELNINIWPFSRSRSAGNAGTRPKLFPGAPSTRKVNSAPCSRSNSAGETKSRKWPNSPGRAGIHLGRSSPVWQVRRGVGSTSPKNTESQPLNPDKGSKRKATIHRSKLASTSVSGGSGSGKGRVLNLNVPMCIGYRQNLSCRSDENSANGVSGGPSNIRGSNGGDVNGNGNGNVGSKLFNLRSLFTKKSLVTSH